MDEMTEKVFAEANVKLRQHSPPSMHVDFSQPNEVMSFTAFSKDDANVASR